MSAKPPKAEVAIHEADVRYVPTTEVAFVVPLTEPAKGSSIFKRRIEGRQSAPADN